MKCNGNKEQQATSNKQQATSIPNSIFHNLSAGIVINDDNFNIVYINKYLSNTNKPPITAGQGCYKSLNGSGRQCVGCPLIKNKKIKNISPVSIEVTGSNSRIYMVNIQTIDIDNSKKAFLELWVDITNKKGDDSQIYDRAFQLESRVNEQIELIESQRKTMIQQDKLASMGKLVAGVAHEINNPVVFIRSNIEVLQKYWEKFKPEIFDKIDNLQDVKIGGLTLDQMVKDVPDILNSMYRGTNRIKNIVSSLKSFSRKTTEEFAKEKVSIKKAIQNSLLLVHSQIKNKIKVTNNIEQNLPHINGYPQSLDQLFVNMFMNAFEADATELTINLKKEFNDIVIELHDNGSGIPDDKIEKIFDPFFTTKGLEGTGLGLSISFGIIEEHGGTIHVYSEVGEGTTFVIKLPYEAKTILVVDDDLIILDIIKRVLTVSGFLIELATDGKKAIEKLNTIEPCLILTDVHMPEMDGFQLIDWIRNNKKHNKIPIMVMTGVEKEVKKINALSISDYILKPFSTKILADTIKNMLKEN